MTPSALRRLPPRSVVTLEGEPSAAFVDALVAARERGAAVAPLDPRLPDTERDRVLAELRPTHRYDLGERRLVAVDGDPAEEGDAVLLATSGSTGRPKIVVHTDRSVEASADASNARLGIADDDHWLACLPLAHVGGLSVVLRALRAEVDLTVHGRFDAEATMRAARAPERPVTRVSLVTRALRQVDPAAFRTVLLGGAAPPPDRPDNVIATYGMTETGSGVVYDRRPLDGVELRVDDTDQVHVRGPMLFRTYRNAPNPTDAEGWFPTGDLGAITDGVLQVWGRAGDVINTGGEKVHPSRTETVLARHPAVAGVAVIGRADPQWGQRVTAIVETVPDAARPGLAELRDLVRQELPVWYAPAELEIVDRLPRTALGKIRRADLT